MDFDGRARASKANETAEMCVPLALSCSPQDKHLEALPSPFGAGCRLRAISGLQPLSGGSPVHTRARAPTPTRFVALSRTTEDNGRKPS